jgi:glycosyltransferase involved in cell wall biosynthesis
MPTVSVIIPSCNRAGFLREAIDSVLVQEFRDFELIVVDDGSTDETPQILESYPQIHMIRQSRQGVSAARNAGIAAASGPFVAFLDSDDLWLPQKLSAQIAFFEVQPNALACQTEEIWIRHGARWNPKKRHRKPSGMIFESSLELCLVSPSAVMIKRRLLDYVGGFDETFTVCEDYDLWLRITCRFPIHLISRPLVIKRGGHKDQLSKQPGLDRFRIRALQKILQSTFLTPEQRSAVLEMLKKKCSIYAAGCFKRGRANEGNEYLQLPARFSKESRDSITPKVSATRAGTTCTGNG